MSEDNVLATVEDGKEKEKAAETTKRHQNDMLEERFMTKTQMGTTLYFDKNRPEKAVIRESEDSIKLLDNNPRAIQAMVEMAQDRGWTTIKVSGNKKLKMAIAAAAHDSGLEVTGFEPPKQQQEASQDDQEDESGSEPPVEQQAKRDTEGPVEEDEDDDDPVAEMAHDKRVEAQKAVQERLDEQEKEGSEKTPQQKAYETLERDEAIEQFPELAPVYRIAANSKAFLERNRSRFDDKAVEPFLQGVLDSCFERIAQGKSLDERVKQTERSLAKEIQEQEVEL